MIEYGLTILAAYDRKATIKITENKDYSDSNMEESGKELAGILIKTLPHATVLAVKKAIDEAVATHEAMIEKRFGKS